LGFCHALPMASMPAAMLGNIPPHDRCALAVGAGRFRALDCCWRCCWDCCGCCCNCCSRRPLGGTPFEVVCLERCAAGAGVPRDA